VSQKTIHLIWALYKLFVCLLDFLTFFYLFTSLITYSLDIPSDIPCAASPADDATSMRPRVQRTSPWKSPPGCTWYSTI